MDEESIQIAVRIRPVNLPSQQATAVSFVGSTVAVTSDLGTEQTDVDCILVEASDKAEEASQERVFQALGKPIVQGALQGISQGVIFYGAAGSGKTFTLLGTREEPGLLVRLGQALLQPDGLLDLQPVETRVWFSSLEIFSDQVQDLLASQSLSERRDAPAFIHHPILGTQVVGATEVPVESSDLGELIEFALKRRALGGTCLHASSNRSSQAYCLRVETRGASGQESTAKVCLFDLASPALTSHRESCPSLAALKTTVQELQQGIRHRHFLFDASPLTLALRDSLDGRWRTTLVATLLAGSKHALESTGTMQFARMMQQLRTRPVASKMLSDQVQLLKDEVMELRKEAEFGLGAQLKAVLDDRTSLIAELMKHSASQSEERRKLARQRAKALEWCGLLPGSSEPLRRKDKITPHLLNMSDDPTLAGCLLYFLPRGERTSVGSDLDSTIVFDGLGILPNLCSITNKDDMHVSMTRPDFARRHVLHNCKMLNTSESTMLSHNDTICLGRAQLLLLKIPLQSSEGEEDQSILSPLQEECKLPEELSQFLPTLQLQGDITFDKVLSAFEHSDSLKYVQCYVKDLLPKLAPSNALACFTTLREACYLLDEANLITREVRPQDHMHFQVELIWDIERHPEEVLLIGLLNYGNGTDAPAKGAADCQVLHYWSYGRFLEKLDHMRDVHRMHCQGLQGWTGRGDPLQDPWLEPSTAVLRQHLLTKSWSCKQEQRHEVRKAVPETEELKVLKSRIAELVQEVEDKNAELEEKTQIVGQLKEQMAQIIPLVGGFAPEAAERLFLEQPEPEAPCSKEKHDSQPSDTEHSCTMTVSASSEGGAGLGDVRDSERSRGFRVDNFGTSKGNTSGAAMLSQSSLTPPHYYRDLRR